MHNHSAPLQVQDIKEVFTKAAESRESALKFLTDAGIIPAQAGKANLHPKNAPPTKKP